MIDRKGLNKHDTGRWVRYYDGHREECGRVKSWNNIFVFVVFHCAGQWDDYQNYTGGACDYDKLTFIKKPKDRPLKHLAEKES